MTKHTKGPWIVGKLENSTIPNSLAVFPSDVSEGQKTRAICLLSPLAKVTEEDEANGALLAAAPDLLAALKDVTSVARAYNDTEWGIKRIERAESAIAKAEAKP